LAPNDAASRIPRSSSVTPRRINVGCGPVTPDGWIHVDRFAGDGVHVVADLRDGLPIADRSLDVVVAMHVLQDLAYPDIVPALSELRRILRPGGVLRAGVPDLERAMMAFLHGDRRYFYVPDEDAASAGAKLVVQAIWYGSVRTPFTWDFAREVCARAGFDEVRRAGFHVTSTGRAGITDLDNRERETLVFEAVR
jgi:SAM-dependent methyltransferase